MSLLIDAPFSSVTTYRKDYIKKSSVRSTPIVHEADYRNPIAGPVEEHVLPYFKYKELPKDQTRYPHPEEYAYMVASKYPTTRTILKDPPDLAAIDKLYANDNRSIYMVSYCRLNDDATSKKKKAGNLLPEGWVIPRTTHQCSYRNPTVMSPGCYQKMPIIRPKNNLAPNMKEREILDIRTGETVYIADISNTGDEIIEGKLHGDVNVRPQFDQDELLRAKLIRTH